MSVPVLTFFNNKGGVGKTSLVYHLAWMLYDLGYRVLACDLDPQANLTAAFLDEEGLENLWDEKAPASASKSTIFECVKPLTKVGDLHPSHLQRILWQLDFGENDLRLIPGDLALAEFEDILSTEWPNAMGSNNLYRSFRILTAFSTIMQKGAVEMDASIILVDVGPNLGAINRSALIASDYVVVPLGADLFSLRGLQNLGPTLKQWRQDWQRRKDNWNKPDFALPKGSMKPIGYVMQQHGIRLKRPIKAYDKWVNRMPEEYARNLLENETGLYPSTPEDDPENSLATLKHYRSLVPMAQEYRKPIFHLKPADGAFGSHAAAVKDAYQDFRNLAEKIAGRIGIEKVKTLL
jgi:cellulose biosynthesis protein BcsQ